MKLPSASTWIVGASSGIGAALARELTGRGARVAVSARRREQLDELVAAGDALLAETCDVTDAAATATAHAAVVDALGDLDLVVLAAGYWRRSDGRAWDTREFDHHLDVNLRGLSHGIAAALPAMLARGSGTIAGVASVAGYRGLPGAEYYGATKAAQINLLEALRASVAGRGVHVTTICPGFVRTEMTQGNDFPMPFIVEPEQAAAAIADGLAADRHEIVFPRRMAVAMKAARWAPVGWWARGVRRR